MPTYTFKNKDTGEIVEKIMSLSQYEKFHDDNLERYFDAPIPRGDAVRLGLIKPDGAFNEVLAKIHERNYKSSLNDKLSRNP